MIEVNIPLMLKFQKLIAKCLIKILKLMLTGIHMIDYMTVHYIINKNIYIFRDVFYVNTRK